MRAFTLLLGAWVPVLLVQGFQLSALRRQARWTSSVGGRGQASRTRRGGSGAAVTMDMESLEVEPIGKCEGEVVLPGSKSLSNRALLLAALSDGETVVRNLLLSDDTHFMLEALRKLGIQIQEEAGTFRVKGNGGPFTWSGEGPCDLFLGNAGTAMRPLAAALCFGEGSFHLDGVERMRERPIADLVDGLAQLGCVIQCSDTGCPPLQINAKVRLFSLPPPSPLSL